MRLTLTIAFLYACFQTLAQDEMPDYRNKKEAWARISDKTVKAELATFALAGVEDRIGKTPLKNIPAREYSNNFILFEEGDIKVKVVSGNFDPSKHRLDSVEKWLVKIDKKPYYGDYGSIPRYTIQSVTFIIGRDTVAIPPTAVFDLYSPSFAYTDSKGLARTFNAVYMSADGRRIYLYMLNREKVGSYEVTWVIQDKKFLRRVVDSGVLTNR
jgi:hypothetical protein